MILKLEDFYNIILTIIIEILLKLITSLEFRGSWERDQIPRKRYKTKNLTQSLVKQIEKFNVKERIQIS